MNSRILFLCLMQLGAWSFLSAQKLQSLGSGIYASYVNDVVVYRNQLYAGGNFLSSQGVQTAHIMRYVGGQWVAPQGGIDGFGLYPFVSKMCVSDNKLHVTGGFDIAGGLGVEDYAIWDSVQWSGNGQNLPSASYPFEFRDTLYCAKNVLANSAGIFPALYKWDGSQWVNTVDIGFSAGPFNVQGITCSFSYGDSIVVAGEFNSARGNLINNIAMYNGQDWKTMGNGLPGKVRALELWNNELYAGGDFKNSTFNYLAKWDGTSWLPVTNNLNGPILALKAYQMNLIIGGAFKRPKQGMAIYNGTSFQAPFEFNAAVNTFAEYNGELIIGGNFDTIDSDFYDHIVSYSNAVGTHEYSKPQIELFPNPLNSHKDIHLKLFPGVYSIKIYNIQGVEVYNESELSGELVIPTNLYRSGVYTVIASENLYNRASHLKLIIQ